MTHGRAPPAIFHPLANDIIVVSIDDVAILVEHGTGKAQRFGLHIPYKFKIPGFHFAAA